MSTLRLAERDCVKEDAADAWVEIVAPASTIPQPGAPGVILSIAEARSRYAAGDVDDIVVDDADLQPHDEVGAEMADYFDSVWDD